MIRILLLASAASLALATGALAADLPNAKGPPAYVPPPPVFTWSGLYVGGQVGEQWGTTSSHAQVTSSGAFAIATPNYQNQGVVGGGHIGYNLQVTQFVFGIEGDVEGSSFDGSGLNATGLHIVQTSIPIQGSIRARAGIAWDHALIYATGGAALASINSGATVISGTPVGGVNSASSTRVGWTLGGGVEYALDNNWSVRAEYRYTDFGNTSLLLLNTYAPSGLLTRVSHVTDNAVRLGFSYKFDMFAPGAIVAKY